MIDAIQAALRGYRFQCAHEFVLQEGIARVLAREGIAYQRERQLGRDRVDFFVGSEPFPEGIAVEVKIDGSLSEVTRQLHRYAAHPDVVALVLVTTRSLHCRMPREMRGKPLAVVHLEGSAF